MIKKSASLWKLKLYLRSGLKLKKINCVLEFNQSQWLKSCIEFNTKKIIEADKNGYKDGKTLYKLMNNVVYSKTMENVRKKINVKLKLVNNKKGYLKCTSKPSYMSHTIFEYNLVAIRKSKVALKLKNPAYIGMSILKFICTNYIMIKLKINMTTNQNYYLQTLIV